jgi:hypothetical protein
MALDDCLDLRWAFEKADAELGAGIDRLIPIEEPGNEAGRVINDAALDQLAELVLNLANERGANAGNVREKAGDILREWSPQLPE